MTIFAERRQRLMNALGDDTLIVVPSARMVSRNSDVEYPFRQDSDFYYLTGFDEPDSVLVLAPGREGGATVMFVRPRDPEKEIWTGRRAGVDGVCARFGADAGYPVDTFEQELTTLCAGRHRVAVALGADPAFDAQVLRAAQHHRRKPRLGLEGPDVIIDLRSVLHEQRLIKTAPEADIMRRAGRLTAEAHNEAMRLAAPGRTEREVQAAVEYVFVAGGAARVGYTSIVAGGDNATILHYNENNQPLADDALLLIDAGAEVDYYSADITRTFPVSGRFTAAQRDVYDVVLEAQEKAIATVVAGRHFGDIHDVSRRALVEGMVSLGLLEGSVDGLIESGAYRRFFMHRTGHWLGMDVHDVGQYAQHGASRVLEPGMVTTVEPGIYVASDDDGAPEAFRGIGIRIEDDILVTMAGPENLTEAAAKAPAAVEAMCAEAPRFVRPVEGL